MSSDAIAIQTAEAASRPWVETLHEWVTTVDHKRLGILYILYALVFLVIAGIEATIIRIQLMHPHNDFVSPQVFNRMFTMHGTTMIFFVVMPVLFGFANYLVPLMIGARDMAFPRLNAFSFWLTAFGGFLLYFSFLGGSGLYGAGNAPDVGWWAYAPLTSRAFSPGHSSDYWTIALLVSGFGSIGTAINIIATIISMRCPGMTLGRMPLLVWLNLVMSGMVLIAITPLSAAQLMLLGRSLSGRPLLRYASRRLGHALDALLLDLRTSGSLRPGDSRLRVYVGDHPGVFPQTDFRISGYGRRHGLHRLREHERVGAPHVHHRNELVRQQLFRDHHDGGRHSDGNQDLQLARHHVGREDPVQDADAVLHRIPVSVPDRRSHRHHAGHGALRLAAQRLVLRCRAFSLRDRWRNSVCALRGVLLLVPENHRKNAERNASANSISGCS